MPRFLIIRFSSIGDIVLTTPIVRCLKQQVPGAEIHYLTKKQYSSLLSANPRIDKVWEYDDNFAELLPELKKASFDFVIDLHNNLRSHYVTASLHRPSAAFPKLNVKKWLLVRLKINLLPPVHIVDRYFSTVSKLGVTNDGEGLDYFIPVAGEVTPDLLPETHRHGYIAIVTGGKHNTKIFPPERIAALCPRLPKPVILLGGKEDRERGELIVKMTGGKVYNACGIYSVNQSASLLRQADTVITNDTGLMHIAAALKKPVISIWGNTIPAFGMYPYLPKGKENLSSIVEVTGFRCRPCSKLGYPSCPKKHFNCMNRISDDQILSAL